ncbi:putative addiction module antidote protein [Sphingobium wenxiniae]|uniref:Putative addiction module antidote protein n=1 Tax=Sphingobium wenxiniae (strain DSM 21828 / CGMCC 1.7748 / JZ-1) TaxID=595605 RepID=A0A562KLB1_SPHWJ|nr:addiction module antidote protein [Sphingobium wenxiniae]MBB6191177.1 putative addiction module antidote protein [Sphingobium wenxiniae]TWH96023.1 putative addiction module antidote protein [Sphingobium wenxiniae]
MVTTTVWDVTEHLDSEEAIAAYLDAVMEEGDPALVVAALGDVAKARGMTDIAARTGVSRAGLYKALGEGGNPTLSSLMGIMKALGVRLAVAA